MNTLRDWKYNPQTGNVTGPKRAHDKDNGFYAKSEIVAHLGCSEHNTYRHYPKAIADKHGELIALGPEMAKALRSIVNNNTWLPDSPNTRSGTIAIDCDVIRFVHGVIAKLPDASTQRGGYRKTNGHK